MEAREIMARRAPSLEERINALRDKGVVIGGTTYRYNFAQISAATGVSRSMISMFANGNIRIKPEQQKILEDWVSDIERQAQEEAIETGAVEETPAPAPQGRDMRSAKSVLPIMIARCCGSGLSKGWTRCSARGFGRRF